MFIGEPFSIKYPQKYQEYTTLYYKRYKSKKEREHFRKLYIESVDHDIEYLENLIHFNTKILYKYTEKELLSKINFDRCLLDPYFIRKNDRELIEKKNIFGDKFINSIRSMCIYKPKEISKEIIKEVDENEEKEEYEKRKEEYEKITEVQKKQREELHEETKAILIEKRNQEIKEQEKLDKEEKERLERFILEKEKRERECMERKEEVKKKLDENAMILLYLLKSYY